MINKKYKRGISEVLHYLNGINQEDIDKIPDKFKEFLEENKDTEYICTFDYNKSLNEIDGEISDEAKGIIGLIAVNYWCENEEEKITLLKQFNENEKEYQKVLREKYNPDNLFEQVKKNEDNKDTKDISVLKENSMKNIFSRILEKIKSFMRRK